MKRRCFAMSGKDRCELEPHTDETLHRNGPHVWGSRDPYKPEWLKRAEFRRDFTDAA